MKIAMIRRDIELDDIGPNPMVRLRIKSCYGVVLGQSIL